MPHGTDDPRQVLSILNSLGFVGITADQLKSFMKDLKLHRKMKERQREQWQEETKKKIVSKQRQVLAELISPNSNNNSFANVTDDDSSVVKIKIKCLKESDIDEGNKDEEKNVRTLQRRQSLSPSKKRETKSENNLCARHTKEHVIQRIKASEINEKHVPSKLGTVKKNPMNIDNVVILSENNSRSRSRSKSVASDSVAPRNPSRSSSQSQSKSFIRPWKLHPEVHRPPQNVKSDPVLLYQQYQKGWKQKLLPGENRHAAIRWAVREKMLGTDPTPRPILRKSSSSMSVKKR